MSDFREHMVLYTVVCTIIYVSSFEIFKTPTINLSHLFNIKTALSWIVNLYIAFVIFYFGCLYKRYNHLYRLSMGVLTITSLAVVCVLYTNIYTVSLSQYMLVYSLAFSSLAFAFFTVISFLINIPPVFLALLLHTCMYMFYPQLMTSGLLLTSLLYISASGVSGFLNYIRNPDPYIRFHKPVIYLSPSETFIISFFVAIPLSLLYYFLFSSNSLYNPQYLTISPEIILIGASLYLLPVVTYYSTSFTSPFIYLIHISCIFGVGWVFMYISGLNPIQYLVHFLTQMNPQLNNLITHKRGPFLPFLLKPVNYLISLFKPSQQTVSPTSGLHYIISSTNQVMNNIFLLFSSSSSSPPAISISPRIWLIVYIIVTLVFSIICILILRPHLPLIITRKLFHLIILIILLPPLTTDLAFLSLASVGALIVFLIAEPIRIYKLPFLGPLLSDFTNRFTDHRDSYGLFNVTHIFLLIGTVLPAWLIYLVSDGLNLPHHLIYIAASGISSLCLGDSFASVFGVLAKSYYHPASPQHWKGSSKTIIGSIGFCIGMRVSYWLITECLVASRLITFRISMPSSMWFVFILSSLCEAFTSDIDNLVLPIFTTTLMMLHELLLNCR